MKESSLRQQCGSTLIEVMLSVIIFAILVIAGGAATLISRSSIAELKNKHVALAEAVRIIEISRDSSDLKSEETNPGEPVRFYEDPFNIGALTLDPQPDWQANINGQLRDIVAELETVGNNLNELTVRVYYTDDQYVTLKSRISNF